MTNHLNLDEKDVVTEQHVENRVAVGEVEEVLLNHENLSYGASGMTGLYASPFVFAAAFLASMGGFSFGYGTF